MMSSHDVPYGPRSDPLPGLPGGDPLPGLQAGASRTVLSPAPQRTLCPALQHAPFDLAAEVLVANGYSVLPLQGKLAIDADWRQRCDQQLSQHQIERCLGRGHNVGVALGYSNVVAIDIDTDDPAATSAIRSVIPQSNVAKRGQRGRTDFYRLPGPRLPSSRYVNRDGEIIVELLAKGRFCAVPPSVHPGTRMPYLWLTQGTLLNTPAAQLPECPVDILDRLERVLKPELAPQTGCNELFPGLRWSNRPTIIKRGAPEGLERVWVATVMAFQELRGAIRAGSCFYMNLAALPLVEEVLRVPATACAGYANFIVPGSGKLEFGLRWRPQKWRPHLADTAAFDDAARQEPLQDVHVWIETHTHVIDFSTFRIAATMPDAGIDAGAGKAWPPMIYWPKWELAKHPREARGRQTVLLWRDTAALAIAAAALAPVVEPIARRAHQIYGELIFVDRERTR